MKDFQVSMHSLRNLSFKMLFLETLRGNFLLQLLLQMNQSLIPFLLIELLRWMMLSLPSRKWKKFLFPGDSAAGPDAFSGKFYSNSWEIIGNDLQKAILEFFAGFSIPKSWTRTLIPTMPKVDNPSTFQELRPNSKVLSTRTKVLPSLISCYQSGFTKARDNILLAQELMNHLEKKVNGSNLILKLDMGKAFDRLSAHFLVKVRRRFAFHEIFIDQIWRLISEVCFSLLFNGNSLGPFLVRSQALPFSPPIFHGMASKKQWRTFIV